jgi:hypothetical protein
MNHARIIDQNVDLEVTVTCRAFGLDFGYEIIRPFVGTEISLKDFTTNFKSFCQVISELFCISL